MSPFLSELQLSPLPMQRGRRWYRLITPLIYDSPGLSLRIIVPAGFPTDMASVPRVAQMLLQKDEGLLEAAVIHDYLYRAECDLDLTRREADRVFLEAMTLAGVGPVKRGLAYHAVRLGGARSWRTS